MRVCEVEGCEGKHEAKGLCKKHYYAKRREDPEVKQRKKEYYAKNKQRIREYHADPEVKQRRKENNAKWYAKNYTEYYANKNKQRKKKYHADPEVKQRRKEYATKYYAKNKQRKKEYNTRYYAKNKQRISEYNKKKHGYTGGAGLQPDAPNYVYIVANDELGAAKVGIGSRYRVSTYNRKGWEVVYLSPLMTKQDAIKLERAIIGHHGVGGVVSGNYLTKEELSSGHTETFDLRELDAVLGIMPILCGESDRIDHEEKAT